MIEQWTVIENERRKFLHDEFEALGISYGEAVVLLVVANNPASSQDMISLRTGFGKTSIAKILSALEEMQLIAREINHKNKREKLTCLLPEGRDLIERLADCIRKWHQICFNGLTADEMSALNHILNKISCNLNSLEPEEIRLSEQSDI